MKNTFALFALSGALCLLSACTPQNARSPQFYPNPKLNAVGPAQARADAEHCKALADEYVQNPSQWKTVAKETGKSAVVGTAAGAVGGSIFSKAGRGAGAGAAAGAIFGLVRGLEKAGEPNPDWDKFVEHCLAEKGYRVYGWSD